MVVKLTILLRDGEARIRIVAGAVGCLREKKEMA